MITLKALAILLSCLVSLWTLACIVDRATAEPPAPDAYYPSVGQVLHSRAEGFTSRVLATDRDHVWLELTLAPHAPGPPPHVHANFAEHFFVVNGVLSLRVGSDIKQLHAGEEFRVPPGVIHQPFNTTDQEVVVRGPITPEYAIPRDFVLFLTQVYGFIDEDPQHARPPAIVLQMSLFGPRYDLWRPEPPIAVQRIQSALLRPMARLLGYRSYYPRFAPRTGEPASDVAACAREAKAL